MQMIKHCSLNAFELITAFINLIECIKCNECVLCWKFDVHVVQPQLFPCSCNFFIYLLDYMQSMRLKTKHTIQSAHQKMFAMSLMSVWFFFFLFFNMQNQEYTEKINYHNNSNPMLHENI